MWWGRERGVSPKETRGKKKEPKISLEFWSGPHRTPEDFSDFANHFQKTDVLLFECPSKLLEDEFNKCAQGKINPQFVENIDPYFKKWLEIIYNSKKPIIFVDFPTGLEDNSRASRVFESLNTKTNVAREQARRAFLKGDLAQAIKKREEEFGNDLEANKFREKIIKDNIRNSIKNLAKNFPSIREKKEIKILMSAGSAHSDLYHDLRKEFPASRQMSRSLTVYPVQEEFCKRSYWGKRKIDVNQYSRTFIEEIIIKRLLTITGDTNKLYWITRKITSKLSYDDIAEMAKQIGKMQEASQKIEAILSLVETKLCLRIPTSEREIDEFLKLKYFKHYK